MEENPTAGLVDDTSDIEIDYDEDGNPIAPPKKKVSTLIYNVYFSINMHLTKRKKFSTCILLFTYIFVFPIIADETH